MPAPPAETLKAPLRSTPRRRAGLRLAAAVAVQLSFLLAILLVSACNTPEGKLTGFDLLVLPGERIDLKAKIERDGPGFLNRDLEGLVIEFLGTPVPGDRGREDRGAETAPDPAGPLPAGAVLLGTALSDGDGIARIEATAPAAPGNHLHWVRLKDPGRLRMRQALTVFIVSVTRAEEPLVITDIDNTIAWTRIRAVLDDQAESMEPLPGSARVLMDLSREHRIVYLTARSSYLAHRTRRWLSVHGFPAGPVLFRDLFGEWRRFQFSEGEFKERLIRDEIKKKWPDIRWGFGNTRGDVEAYGENGIRSLMIAMDPREIPERYRRLIRPVTDWDEARRSVSP